jgi:hypothetical protein
MTFGTEQHAEGLAVQGAPGIVTIRSDERATRGAGRLLPFEFSRC